MNRFQNNKPFLIVGSPGGSTIITTTMQTILNVIDHKMNIKEKERHLLMWVNAKDEVGHVIMPYKLINCFIAFLSFHVI